MKIPYKLIHQLESQYGSLSLVPDNNYILQKIQNFFVNYNDGRANRDSHYDLRLESEIIDWLELGYTQFEIQRNLKIPHYRIQRVMSKYGLTTKPRFKFVATEMATGKLIYSYSYHSYNCLIHHNCDYFERTQKLLRENGYKLEASDEIIRWSQLRPGDQYIDYKKLCTKN